MAPVYLMLACLERSFSQVVICLPLGLVTCMHPMIRSNALLSSLDDLEKPVSSEGVYHGGWVCAGLVKNLIISDMLHP